MGLVTKYRQYKENRQKKKISKSAKLVTNAKAIKEDRWAALEFLAALKEADKAVEPLLQRFEYSLEHGINDTREKELALKGIVDCGEGAIPFISQHLQKTTKIAWPIKVLMQLGQDKVVMETLKAALDFSDVAFNQLAVDKNYDILCYLRDYDLEDFAIRIEHFLKDPDERVRFAAAEVMIEQKDQKIPALLEPYLLDATSENRRIKQSVVSAFVRNQWEVIDKAAIGKEPLGEGVSLRGDGKLQSRVSG